MKFFAPEGQFPPAGMFTIPHIVGLVIALTLIIIAIIFSLNIKDETLKRITLIIAITVTVLECIKIGYKFLVNQTPIKYLDGWVPLFYCSLFIYTSWMTLSHNHFIASIADSFISGGCIVGGLAFLICPSTSLMLVPIWHFLSIHSLLYHSLMVYLGFLYILKGKFKPGLKNFSRYTIFLLIFMIPCLIVNLVTKSVSLLGPDQGANLMLLSYPVNLPFEFVYTIYHAVPWLYPFLAMLVYILVPYGVSCLILLILKKLPYTKRIILQNEVKYSSL